MATQMRRTFWIATFLAAVSASALASDNLRLDLEPVFEGNAAGQGVYPVVADIQNLGPDAHGVLSVNAESRETDYPVELPRGAHKRIVTYPISDFGNLHFVLDTDHGKVESDFAARPPRVNGIPVLLISDVPGEFAFIVGPPQDSGQMQFRQDAATLIDAYARPDLAPARPIGYSSTSKVVLGSGSERLSDEQVAALKLWVVTGGTLMFVGGVSSPVISDSRWADILPARDFHVTQLIRSQVLSNLGGTGDDMPAASILTGTPVKGCSATSDGSNLLWCERPYGLGRVLYISFNPFEAPLNRWAGRKEAMTRLLRPESSIIVDSFLARYSDSGYGRGGMSVPYSSGGAVRIVTSPPSASGPARMGSAVPMSSGPAGPIISMAPPPMAGSIKDDPFSMTLPPTEQIFTVLAAYFVCVVPINFLVLRKLKRGELAWITAPIISLAFAGMLFRSAGSLYKAGMSTVTSGVVVAQDGSPEAMFIGGTQMFVPRAGSYDLKLKNVDSLGFVPDQEPWRGGGMRSGDDSASFASIDDGEIEVPGMSTNNLTFRRLTYRQRVPISSWFHVQLSPAGETTARCEVTNSSSFTLRNAQIDVGANSLPIGDLPPGKKLAMTVSLARDGGTPANDQSDIHMFTLNKSRVALTGQLDGFRPGPQIGESIPGRSEIDFAMFSSWEGGAR